MTRPNMPSEWAGSPTVDVILGWADAHSIDLSQEEVGDLRRRIHDSAIPFDSQPQTVERCVTDAIDWMADRAVGPIGAEMLRRAAAGVSEAFVAAGLVERPRYAVGRGGEPRREQAMETDEPEKVEGGALSLSEHIEQPARRDVIYTRAVSVAMEDGGTGVVRFPAYNGRVRVNLPNAPAVNLPVDDLTQESRARLRSSRVRRRVRVVVRCTHAGGCSQALFAWLTPDGSVEDTQGEPIDTLERLDLLFSAVCGRHDHGR